MKQKVLGPGMTLTLMLSKKSVPVSPPPRLMYESGMLVQVLSTPEPKKVLTPVGSS